MITDLDFYRADADELARTFPEYASIDCFIEMPKEALA